ncbi:MAG: histidine phosphatase family protein [Gammaproteobacteria bacterium]|nr:histidine phosphatase family protein [Gammaproteobacteria bacterium]
MREKEPSTRILYVRHGETDFPLDRIYCDSIEDPPLNARGQVQAATTAEALRVHSVDQIYSSPSQRTRMTAAAIAAPKGLAVNLDPGLVERHFGIWEGLYFDEIERQYPEEYQCWKRDQAAFQPSQGESMYALVERTEAVIKRLVETHRGQTLVVVTHVGPIRALVAEAIGLPLAAYRQLRIDPASVTCVDYGVKGNNLIFLNFHSRHGMGVEPMPLLGEKG